MAKEKSKKANNPLGNAQEESIHRSFSDPHHKEIKNPNFDDEDLDDEDLHDEDAEEDLNTDETSGTYKRTDRTDNYRKDRKNGSKGKKKLYRRFVAWLIAHTGTPHTIALGFAVGLFVALTPTVGFQMALGALFAHIVGGNRLIAAALAWITNPLTLVPIYYFNYQVGLLFIDADVERGKAFIHALSEISLFRPGTLIETIRLTAVEFAGIAWVLWAGSLVVATIVALVSYPIIKRLVGVERKLAEKHRQRRMRRKKMREAKKRQKKERKLRQAGS